MKLAINITDDKFQVGQVWEYKCRPHENDSRVVIVAVSQNEKQDIIVSVYLIGLKVKNPQSPTGITSDIQHLPFAKESLSKSVTVLLGMADEVPDFREGFETWKQSYESGDAGVFSVTVKEAVTVMEQALGFDSLP